MFFSFFALDFADFSTALLVSAESGLRSVESFDEEPTESLIADPKWKQREFVDVPWLTVALDIAAGGDTRAPACGFSTVFFSFFALASVDFRPCWLAEDWKMG